MPSNFPPTDRPGGINFSFGRPLNVGLNVTAHILDSMTNTPKRRAAVAGAIAIGSLFIHPSDVLGIESYEATFAPSAAPYDNTTGLRGPLPEGARLGPLTPPTTFAEIERTNSPDEPELIVISDTGDVLDREGFFDRLDTPNKIGFIFGGAAVFAFFFWKKVTPASGSSVTYDPEKDLTLQRRLARERRREAYGRIPRIRKVIRHLRSSDKE